MSTTQLPQHVHFLSGSDWYRATLTNLGPQNRVAQRLAAAAVTKLPKVFGQHNLSAKDDLVFVGVRQRELRLQTSFVIEGDVLVPRFVPNAEGSIQIAPVFTIPDELVVTLGVAAKFLDGVWWWQACNFFAAFGGQSHILPLPNVYNDSNVCMGRGFMMSKPSLEELVNAVNASFIAAPWNADLADDTRFTKAKLMFRCNTDGEPLPLVVSNDTLIPVSHPYLEYYA